MGEALKLIAEKCRTALDIAADQLAIAFNWAPLNSTEESDIREIQKGLDKLRERMPEKECRGTQSSMRF